MTRAQRFLRGSSVVDIVGRLHEVLRCNPGWMPLRLVVGSEAWRHFGVRRAAAELALPIIEHECAATAFSHCSDRWHVGIVLRPESGPLYLLRLAMLTDEATR
jgi:hypothetical protein